MIKRKWNNKNFHTYDFFLKEKFKEKVGQISIDGGFTCPNRDGTKGINGCIFCSQFGAGDFIPNTKSITEQYKIGKEIIKHKWNCNKYIIYFQSFTNTYAPVEYLKSLYYSALLFPNVVGISIGTRPDCLSNEVLNLLEELNKKTFVTVELGLQTSNEESREFINSKFTNEDYIISAKNLHNRNINFVTHLIYGLPNEDKTHMLNSLNFAINNKTKGLKIHNLQVLKGTLLGEMYAKKPFPMLSKEEYVNLIVHSISITPENIVFHRLTGDGKKEDLLAPLFSLYKRDVLNSIDKELRKQNIYQGMNCI